MDKKILIITPGFLPLLGGMEDQVYTLSQEFISRGYQVDILTEQTQHAFPLKESIDGISVYRLKRPNRSNTIGYIRFILQFSQFIIKEQKNYHFVLIRTFTIHGLVIGGLKYLKFLKIKTMITCDTGGENDELDLLLASKFKNIMVKFFSSHNYLNALCYNNIEKFTQLGFKNKKVTKIYNGLDVKKYIKSQYPKRISNFLFLAQLRREKGIYELLEAFRRILNKYPKTKLYIAGDGPEKQGINDFIKKYSLAENIIYLGRISKEEKDHFFSLGQCLILPSYSESFGLVIGEAAIYKRYVLATDVGDLKKIYPDIIFCKKRSIEDLSNKMEILLSKTLPIINYDKSIKLINIKSTVNQIIDKMESL